MNDILMDNQIKSQAQIYSLPRIGFFSYKVNYNKELFGGITIMMMFNVNQCCLSRGDSWLSNNCGVNPCQQ